MGRKFLLHAHAVLFPCVTSGRHKAGNKCMQASWLEQLLMPAQVLCQHTLHAAHALPCKELDLQLLPAGSQGVNMYMQSVSRPRSNLSSKLLKGCSPMLSPLGHQRANLAAGMALLCA